MIPIVSKESFLGHQKSTRLFVSLLIIILAVAFLLLPGFLRKSDTVIGDKPYYHLRMAHQGLKDELSFSGRDEVIGIGWNFLLRFISLNIILFAMGVLSLALFYLILENHSLSERLSSIGFFILSPAFIYLFNVGERYGIVFLLSLSGFYLLMKRKYIFSLICIAAMFAFDYYIPFLVLFGYGIYKLHSHRKKVVFFSLIFLFLIFTLVFGEWNKNFISDLGSRIGISIFGLFLVFFCTVLFWNKQKYRDYYWVTAALFLFALRFEAGIFYFSLFFTILIALYFVEIYGMKWESKLIRDLTVLVILCGLLFSGLSYANRLSKSMPGEEIFEALERPPDGAVVLSGINYGHWISYSGKRNVWDSFSNVPGFKEREKDMSIIINYRDQSEVTRVLNKYNVDYILLDPELRKEWGEKGILYLLKYNTEDFRKVTKDEEVEIWRYFK